MSIKKTKIFIYILTMFCLINLFNIKAFADEVVTTTQEQENTTEENVDESNNPTVIENVDENNSTYPIRRQLQVDGILSEEQKKEIYTNSSSSRQFITFQTKSGKSFYLIINHDKASENVQLLTEVSERDLLEMSKKEAPIISKNILNNQKKEELTNSSVQSNKNTNVEVEASTSNSTKEKTNKNKSNFLSLLSIIVISLGIVAVYYKFFKKKKKTKEEIEKEEQEQFEEFEDASEEEAEEKIEDLKNNE